MVASTAPRRENPLGNLSVPAFMRCHWQKKALLLRDAIEGFAGIHTARALCTLAGRDDVESRVVVREGKRWSLAHGPFRRADFRALPETGWTLLVQGVNRVDRSADALIRRFAFIPFARLDDLMVSYAATGGGVGPHVDSYDVFLLQGFGRRRWRYGRQRDLALRPGLPLRILARFAPTENAVLSPGDMLYLPPHYAHDGAALEPCTTYSIGFRSADATELATAFLDFMRDELRLPGGYTDPDLAPTAAPAEIDRGIVRRYSRLLDGIRWDGATVARFLGSWLSEPKSNVFFEPPERPLARAAFRKRAALRGIELDGRTQLLYDDIQLFINGAASRWPAGGRQTLRRLANARALAAFAAGPTDDATLAILYTWYRNGFLHLGTG